MTTQKTWTTFGPDAPLASLPKEFEQCLPPNKASQSCDAIVGSAVTGQGYCSQPAYQNMTYCSCVNNAVACPEFTMVSCANGDYSYKPWIWDQPQASGLSINQNCQKNPICVNVVEAGGADNVLSNVNQNCGGSTTTAPSLLYIYIILVVMFVIIIGLVIRSTKKSRFDVSRST
jgi:hypothetical protein